LRARFDTTAAKDAALMDNFYIPFFPLDRLSWTNLDTAIAAATFAGDDVDLAHGFLSLNCLELFLHHKSGIVNAPKAHLRQGG
jgi:hypothetical protein